MIQRERLAAMGELIAYVAHNIRNPLAGIQAAAEASSRQLPPDSDVRSHQEAIVTAIIRFQSWLRELEHMCDPLHLAPEEVELRALLDNVVAVFRPMSQRRSIDLRLALPDPHQRVRVDPRHFEQAVAALLGNAIEAAGDRGRVVIGSSSNGEPAHWSLYVEDSGPGIPADRVSRIFEPTYSTKKGGHGLGLALVRKIVQMHGGDIQVQSTPGEGLRMTLHIPNALPERT
jgi:signal transduction histidine kinase